MSGSFLSSNYPITDFASELKNRIETGDHPYQFDTETIEMLKICQDVIQQAAKLAHRVVWLYSGDYSEEAFRKLAYGDL